MMNKDQVNDIVFEALFRQAVIDNFNEEIESIPSNEQLSEIYSTSPKFEMMMKNLFIKDHRKSFLKKAMFYSKRVASIFIIVLGLLFGTLLFNTEVRAAVGKVFVEWYERFTSFTFKDDEIISEKKDWTLGYLSEGYVQENYEVLGRITSIEFTNNQGEKIRFTYGPEEGITNISVDNENHEINSCVILDNEAFSISAVDDAFDNGVIWNMDGHTFDLWGKISVDELKKMAESIIEK
ncbi:DUF4367 domain-containing protein [Sedimentibacter sp.]|uniref:DUF4367 domain-containing protein n=1 Tax=Sedimentibacter sp. TaxID=1960295 RepID=UPI00289F8168|nr:DUF4367 domain-containing protein [Sedimentibacter sp.]